MRVIWRIDIYPPQFEEGGEALQECMVAEALGRLRQMVEREYPDWSVVVTPLIGYADSPREAGSLLAESWVTRV